MFEVEEKLSMEEQSVKRKNEEFKLTN